MSEGKIQTFSDKEGLEEFSVYRPLWKEGLQGTPQEEENLIQKERSNGKAKIGKGFGKFK